MINIEIQNEHGSWKRYSTVPNDDARIERALQAAAAHPLAVDARAVTMSERRSNPDRQTGA
ncbi:MAG: hypothetical protein GY948_05620 [Alphaproteobacteria bacterium]|nr:hypothetical protein [Alphaproteobacteria bacterium]